MANGSRSFRLRRSRRRRIGHGTVLDESGALIEDGGLADVVAPAARQLPVDKLPDDVLVYLLGSRYCETDLSSEAARKRFEHTPSGYAC
jgi:hypothetical protein